MKKVWRVLLFFAAGGIALLLMIQLVPVSRDNPPVVTQVSWDSPHTQEVFQQACADCHSNETVWPWYSRVAPVSWLVARDVRKGRDEFNISDLTALDSDDRQEMPEEVQEVIEDGKMPMRIYLITHPEARLNAQEKQALINGLQQTLRNTP